MIIKVTVIGSEPFAHKGRYRPIAYIRDRQQLCIGCWQRSPSYTINSLKLTARSRVLGVLANCSCDPRRGEVRSFGLHSGIK